MQRGTHKAAVAHVTTLHSVPRRRMDLRAGLARVWSDGGAGKSESPSSSSTSTSSKKKKRKRPATPHPDAPPPPPASHPKRRVKTEEPRPSDASGDPTTADDPPLRKIKKEEVYEDKE